MALLATLENAEDTIRLISILIDGQLRDTWKYRRALKHQLLAARGLKVRELPVSIQPLIGCDRSALTTPAVAVFTSGVHINN